MSDDDVDGEIYCLPGETLEQAKARALRSELSSLRPSAEVVPHGTLHHNRSIALVWDVETSHRTKSIHKQKWRPLQSGFSITEAAKILEHQDDHLYETA